MSAFGSKPDHEFDVDRKIRIERMKRGLEDLADGAMISGGFEDAPPELEEIFLERVCEFEKARWGQILIGWFGRESS